MRKEDCFQLGWIKKTHGLKGRVNAKFDVDFPEKYSQLDTVLLEINNSLVPFGIDEIKVDGRNASIVFEEIESAEEASSLVGCGLFLPNQLLEEVDEDMEYFYHDLIGLEVMDKKLGVIGPIQLIFDEGPQILVSVNKAGNEVLIPWVDDFIVNLDFERQIATLDLPDGLLELTSKKDED